MAAAFPNLYFRSGVTNDDFWRSGKWQPFFVLLPISQKSSLVMKKQTISIQPMRPSLIQGVKSLVTAKLEVYAKLLSFVLEQEISVKNSLRITNAILSFITMLIAASFSITVTLLCLAWLITALLSCKKGGLQWAKTNTKEEAMKLIEIVRDLNYLINDIKATKIESE